MKNLDLTKLSKQKFDILETCYYGLLYSKDKLIKKAIKIITEDDLEETSDVPQQIDTITIKDTAISTELFINKKACNNSNTDW